MTILLSPGGAEVSGQVADATGGSVSGAFVTARGQGSDLPVAMTFADSTGAFQLSVPSGRIDLQAEAEAYSTMKRTLLAPQTGVIFALVPESIIAGRVVDELGAPVALARVTATNQNGLTEATRRTSANSDGAFEFRGLPAGGYELMATALGLRTLPEWVNLELGAAASVQLRAHAAATLRAAVLVGGAACTSGLVTLNGSTRASERVGPQGEVTFEGLPMGRYEVSVRCTAVASTSHSGTEAPNESGFYLEDVVILGQPSNTVTWQIEPAPAAAELAGKGTIRATVATGAEAASPPPTVLARSGVGEPIPGVPDADGVVFSGLPLGDFIVYLEGTPSVYQRVLLARDGEVTQIRLLLPPAATIAGRVLDERGVSIPDAWVSASLAGPRRAKGERVGVAVLSDEQGKFVVTGLPRGSYDISASCSAGEGAVESVLTGRDDLRVVIARYGSIGGTARGPSGEPAPDFVLSYRSVSTGSKGSVVGSAGEWSLPWLAPGEYELSATAQDGCGSGRVTLEGGAQLQVNLLLSTADAHCRLAE